jgi:hypothetical protein
MIGSIGRRPFFALLLAALAGRPRLWAPGAATVADAQPSIGLEEFMALSSRLIVQRTLDPALGLTYLHALVATPATATLLHELMHDGERTAAHDALERDIIQSWYTGVHQVGGIPQVATYGGALVWQVMGRPATGVCAGAMGTWAKPPAERP